MADYTQKENQINDSDEMFWGIKRSPLQVELIRKLREVSDDPEFILSVVTDAAHDDDAQYMLNYLAHGDDLSYSQIILQAMHLSMVRNGEIKD